LTQPSADDAKRPSESSRQARAPEDRVEISENARLRLAELADQVVRQQQNGTGRVYTRPKSSAIGRNKEKSAVSGNPGGQTRLNEVRKRIEEGFYDNPEVKKKIADKLSDEMSD
jgi:hypothetical protein